MHRLQQWARQDSLVMVTQSNLATLKQSLEEDGRSYLYSSLVSLADAMQGIPRRCYSWSTVKLYYSLFYALRSILASSGVGVYYVGKNAYWIRTTVNSAPRKAKESQTHKCILGGFDSELPMHPLAQGIIANTPANSWMISLREQANYRQARFAEPECPKHFLKARSGVRRLLAGYLSDDWSVYAFDEDHAAIAYPLTAARFANDLVGRSSCHTVNERKFLREIFSDKNGLLAPVINAFRLS